MEKPVGYWGEKYAFTYKAALRHFPNRSLKGFSTHKEIYKSLESDLISHAVLPIHNSTAGTVLPTLDIITGIGEESEVLIVDEIYVQISHCLYSNKKDVSVDDLDKYYTIEIAKNQCSIWIDKHLSDSVKFYAVSHNSLAANKLKEARDDENVAAIGPIELARHNNCHVIVDHIEDYMYNTTRFIVLSKEPPSFDDITQCKATIAIILNDRHGALADVVSVISGYGLDIVHLKMIPVVGKGYTNWKDWFIFDLVIESRHRGLFNDLYKKLNDSNDVVRYPILLGVYPSRSNSFVGSGRVKRAIGDDMPEPIKSKSDFVPGKIIDLEEINSSSESDVLEFKSSFRWDYNKNCVNNDLEKQVLKTVAAFLNSKGGNLIIGLNDNGDALGIEKDLLTVKGRNNDGFERGLIDRITVNIGPNVAPFIDIYFKDFKGVTICIVHVKPYDGGAYVNNSDYYIRFGCTTRNLNPREAAEYIKNKKGGYKK